MKTRFAAGAATLMLLAAACTGGSAPAPTTRTTTVSPTPTAEVATLPASLVRFGDYTVVPLADPDSPAYPGPETPGSLSGVQVADRVRQALDEPGVEATLTDQGFVVVPADYRLLHFAYQGNVYEGWPVYVTTDAAYHVWHLTFDKVLRSLESEVLLPELEQLVAQTLEAAHAQTAELAGSPVADAAARAEQLYQVAAAELGQMVALGPLARREKALVDQHAAGPAKSPITGAATDYSVFTPRGHYTRSEALSRYFVAMSVLGQASFLLPSAQVTGLEPTRIALLASRALVSDPARVSLWEDLYEPTAFLVGYADDYTPFELAAAARTATATGLDDPSAFARDDVVREVVAALTSTRPVQVNPESPSVRLMGTRFVLDSYMMDQLIWPDVGTEEKKRLLPSALDVAATLGSEAAHDALRTAGETAYANYEEQLASLTRQVTDRAGADWGGTVYDAWLYALEPVFARHGTAYPDFMRSPAWAAEDLQSGLGSYAQLKHDTILYTKQAMAEGGGWDILEPPRNWVEPDPVAFLRLKAAVDLMRGGLVEHGLATAEQATLLTDVGELFGFLGRIASDELAGTPISAHDDDRLKQFGEELEALWVRTSDPSSAGWSPIADLDSALVADIASGPSGVLEVGTGRFDRLYVLVPDDDGHFAVAQGAVFSYYEFPVSDGQRLTDETWRARLDSGQAPPRPAWQDVLFPR